MGIAATVGATAGLGVAGIATGVMVHRAVVDRRADAEEHRLDAVYRDHFASAPDPGEMRSVFPADPLDTDPAEGYASVFAGTIGGIAGLGAATSLIVGKGAVRRYAPVALALTSGALIGYQAARSQGGAEGRQRVRERYGVDIAEHSSQLIAAFDLNKDAALRIRSDGDRQTEFLKRDTLDIDWDADWLSIEQPLRDLDRNNDGLVNRTEIRAYFDARDGNGDGKMTAAEVGRYRNRPDYNDPAYGEYIKQITDEQYMWLEYGPPK